MKILAIETSCDDTGVAILEVSKTGDFNVLSNIISSQIEVHKKYGGVYPMLAKREHQKNLSAVLVKALEEAKLLKSLPAGRQGKIISSSLKARFKTIGDILEREPELYKKIIPFLKKYDLPRSKAGKPDIDLITVTEGPGLEPCLWVGINFAKTLSYFWNIPIVPVNHVESHILVNFLKNPAIAGPRYGGAKFPAVCLVVSGGHTQLILMKEVGKYKILGETRDDAAGECFDKVAKILGLKYPGGPIISRLASKIVESPTPHKLPRPMINTKDYDFSFSGLKTAILYHHRKQPLKIQKSKKYITEMCFEIQQSVIDILIKKTIKATKDYKAKTIILGGGVSANEELIKQFKNIVDKKIPKTEFFVPETKLSTDNALMTAITGYFYKNKKVAWQKLKAKANLRIG